MTADGEQVARELGQLLDTLLRMHDERPELGGPTRRWNDLVDEAQWLQLDLRTSAAGQAGITTLIDNDCPTVSQWAAAWSLFWDEPKARAHLASGAGSGGLAAYTAQTTLREFDAGRLSMTWTPKRPRRPKR